MTDSGLSLNAASASNNVIPTQDSHHHIALFLSKKSIGRKLYDQAESTYTHADALSNEPPPPTLYSI